MISRSEAEEILLLIENALQDGDYPDGHKCKSHERLASATVSKKLGVHRSVIARKLAEIKKEHGIEPNWNAFKKQKEEDPDHITVRRLKDKLAMAETRAAKAERTSIKEEILRESVFKLAAKPIEPKSWKTSKDVKTKDRKEAMVLLISDVHMGEVIDFDQMGGRNSFNKKICADRLERLFQSVVKMGTTHWSGPPPGVIYVILNGDLISGEIHQELERSNDLLAVPAVRELTAHLISGLELLLESFDCEIRVVSVPGNHSRLTKKPESKGFVVNSYDTLVAWMLESWFACKTEKRITVSAPASGDALININGWNCLFTHGDRIGSRGGMGMIGPAATIARGMQRIIQDFATENIVVDFVFTGHFHVSVELEQGFCNGCLSGASEYSRSGRMRSSAPSQWLFSITADHGVARRWKIYVGHPSEGSLCSGRSTKA